MLYLLLALTFVCVALGYIFFGIGSKDLRLPPGPPTLPLLGNLHQLPTARPHLKFTEWAHQYGEIFSLKIGPSTAIVITSPRLVKELVDKKSIYSHRPPSHIGNEIIGKGDHLLLMPYSEKWRAFRKLVHQFFMESQVTKHYTTLVEAEGVQLLRDLILEPEQYMSHPKRFSNSIIVSLLYGIRTPNTKTKHMIEMYEIMEGFSSVMEPGSTPPVDIFPFLKWIPERFMGRWRSRAEAVGDRMDNLYGAFFDRVVRRRHELGRTAECFMDQVLDTQEKTGFHRHAMTFLVGALMEAGSDTSAAIISAFIHAMTKWPDIQKKAQKQIDEIFDEDHLPSFKDHMNLPYVVACIKETIRWRPVAPLIFPHALDADDWIDGMYLPKGSTVFVNAFGMQHNEERFPNPDVFNPDNFKGVTALAAELATGDYQRRDHWGYGAGRRICQGIHLAERNLFVAISMLLWAFNIERGKDEQGQEIEPDVSSTTAYSAGFLVSADPYPCRISVRSDRRRATIMNEFTKVQEGVFSKYQELDE